MIDPEPAKSAKQCDPRKTAFQCFTISGTVTDREPVRVFCERVRMGNILLDARRLANRMFFDVNMERAVKYKDGKRLSVPPGAERRWDSSYP